MKEIFFDDDTFNYRKERTIELCKKLKPLNFTWSCTSRVTTDYDTLKAMKEAGCRLLIVGYESGDQQILKNIKKGATVDMAERFTANCKKLGLLVHGDFIIGLPGETRESIRKTIDFAKRLDNETIQVSIAHPYPGTEFYDYVKKNGLITIDSMTDETGHQLPNVVYPGLDRGELVEWVERFYGEYFFRPRSSGASSARRSSTATNAAASPRKPGNTWPCAASAASSLPSRRPPRSSGTDHRLLWSVKLNWTVTSETARLRLKTWICVVVVVFSNAFGDFFMKRGLPDSARLVTPLDYIAMLFQPWVALGVGLLILWQLSRMALLELGRSQLRAARDQRGLRAGGADRQAAAQRSHHAAPLGRHRADRGRRRAGQRGQSLHRVARIGRWLE